MTTKAIADRMVELCRNGQYAQAYSELFAPDFESFEMPGMPMERVVGQEGMQQRAAYFHELVQEFHSGYFNEPQAAGNFFTLTMGYEATFKTGERKNFDEVAVYEVRDGKIVRERFFY
jgi:ketosteroid isomerase-like protein